MGRFVLATFWAIAAAPAAADEFHHDFRTTSWRDRFAPFQAKGEELLKDQPEGLRITIPDDWIHPYGGVGVATTFGVQGDFEITTTYEILQADRPPKGYGVGVTLRIEKALPSKELANIARLMRAKAGPVLLWNRLLETPEGPKYPEGSRPCMDTIGRLRLKRTGTTLYFLAAPGTMGDEFDEIHQLEFGADDIKRVLLVAVTGREPAKADVRFIDLRIDSGSMKRVVAQAPAADPGRPQHYWWMIPAGAIAAGLLVLGLVKLRKRDPAPSAATAGAPAATVEAECPNCRKHLKIPAAAASKKVKCPACAATFVA